MNETKERENKMENTSDKKEIMAEIEKAIEMYEKRNMLFDVLFWVGIKSRIKKYLT